MDDFYQKKAKEYIESTFSCDMSEQYKLFEKYAQKGSLLDIGCGSGRDSLYFKNSGFSVTSLDPVEDFCNHVKELGIDNVCRMKVQDMTFDNCFDNIWACASLLHVPEDELSDVLIKCEKALKKNGIMYMSFKYGDFVGFRDSKYYFDMSEGRIKEILGKTGLKILEITITKDVKRRENTEWLNIIVKK